MKPPLLSLPLWLLTTGAPAPEPAAAQAPNVLLVVLDDVDRFNADLVDTPNLDWLASQGVSYRRGYAMPMCEMTRYGILFSLYRGTTNGKACIGPLATTPDPSLYSMPKMFKGAGYATGLFGKWHVGTNPMGAWELAPQMHGFDTWRAGLPTNVNDCGGVDYWSWPRVDDGVSTMSAEYQTTAVCEALRGWWDATPGPKFGYVCLQAPHHPFHEPPASLVPARYQNTTTTRGKYEAMLASADTALGDLLSGIDLAETWVVVVGDNGVAPKAAHPEQDPNKVKQSSFEGGVNVPFVIAGPGIGRSFETHALAHVVDLLPTFADWAGVRVPRSVHTEGRSLVPTLVSPESHVRSTLFCAYDSKGKTGKRLYDRTVVSRRYKLRRVLDVARMLNNAEFLYDLRTDPTEANPLDLTDPAHAEILRRLRTVMDRLEV